MRWCIRTHPRRIFSWIAASPPISGACWKWQTKGLRTGMPQNEMKTGKGNSFDALYADPEKLRGFLKAMTGLSMNSAKAMAAKFPWQKYKTFADVGGAQGGVAVQIATAHPHLNAIVFDLPAVKPLAEEY